jgi:hypothetical protein
MINDKYKEINNTGKRYGVDKHGNVKDFERNKIVPEYSFSGSVKIKFSDGWRSVAQSKLVSLYWSEEIRNDELSDKEKIVEQIAILEKSVQVLKNLLENFD